MLYNSVSLKKDFIGNVMEDLGIKIVSPNGTPDQERGFHWLRNNWITGIEATHEKTKKCQVEIRY